MQQNPLRGGAFFSAGIKAGLYQFNVPVAETVPDKIVYFLKSKADFEFIQIFRNIPHYLIITCQNPFILRLEPLPGKGEIFFLQIH